jgi:serine/threonine protein kinase
VTSTPDAPVHTVSLAPGDVIGTAANSWQVVRHITEGGFSSVYAVRPATPETKKAFGHDDRALKCLRGTADEITQVRDEAEKIAEVEGHENVLGLVTSLRFGDADSSDSGDATAGLVGLVLELGSEDLYDFSRRMRPSEQAWAGIFEQVAAGLEHIHARQVVHGDIKPTNVLRVGASFKIADFGVSRPAGPEGSQGSLLARTLAYLPPESCAGADHVAPEPTAQIGPNARIPAMGVVRTPARTGPGESGLPRSSSGVGSGAKPGPAARQPSPQWAPSQASDVWGLAVSMHRLLTGRHITAGVTPQQQYDLVCQARYSVDDRVSPGWRRLFADCLAHRPEDRSITTAAELRRRLADLAVPEDYVGVPWLPGAPRLVAVLSADQSAGPADANALVLYLTRPGGRVQGTFAEPGGVLLAATRHLHETAVPALAQQVRDAQRAAARAAEERDNLQNEVGRLAASGPATEIMDPAAPTEQIKRLSAEVTSAIRQRDELTRERDRLARERYALTRRIEQLQREAARPPVPHYDYDYSAYPTRSRGRRALGCFFIVLLALTIATSLALLVGSGLAGDPPQDVLEHVVDRIRNTVGGS